MKRFTAAGAFTLAIAIAFAPVSPVHAQDYQFDVNYFGEGVYTLAAGADNPVGTSINVFDRFLWTITATNGFWDVVSGGGFNVFMAFPVFESGTRQGTYTLDLFRNGTNIFTLNETSTQGMVHLGTNLVSLGTGLEFDVMRLDYTLNASNAATTVRGTLPFVGPPESYSGIEYRVAAVPEPSALVLLLAGLAGLCFVAVRRREGPSSLAA